MSRTWVVPAILLCWLSPALAQPPALRCYAPLDDHGRGILLPQSVGIESSTEFQGVVGKVHGAAALQKVALQFPIAPFLSNEEGAVAVWVKVGWDPAETATRMLINLGGFGSLRRWQGQPYLTYTLWYHHLDEKHDYGCTASLEGWKPGQWHHLAITWSWSQRKRAVFVDGKKVRESPVTRIPNTISTLEIGPDADAADELCVYSQAVGAAEVERLYAAGCAAKPAFDFAEIPPFTGALTQLPDSKAPRPPTFVNWSFDGAEQRDNGRRGEVTLHGWWRWQRGKTPFDPPDDSAWLFRKVPAQSHFTESFPVRDEGFRVVKSPDPRVGQAHLDGLPQWCEREFVPPEAWRGRRIVLRLDSLVYESAALLNGRLLGALPRLNLGAEYDITDRVQWGRPNRLTLFSSGVDGDIALVGLPAGPVIEDAWLITSWRKKEVIACLRVQAPTPQAALLRVEILDDYARPPVMTFEARKTLRAGVNEAQFSNPWPENAVAWSLANPRLYTYRVRMLNSNGDLLDETLPARFGFREIWIQDGDFYLNGHPVHFFGHSNAHLTAAAELGDPEYVRYSLRQWRKAGVNCVTPWQGVGRYPTFHPLLDAADELGTAIFPVVGLPTGEYEPDTPRARACWHGLYRRYMERYRQHPSVLGWMIGSGSHNYDFCPAVMDGRFMPDIPKVQPLRTTWAFAQSVDGARPIFGLSNGNIGPVWTSMAYQGFDVDLQERENWPLRWSQKRHKPLMPCEFSLPYFRDWFARSRQRSGNAQYSPKNTQSLATEYGAMFFGPSVYGAEPEDYLQTLQTSPGVPYKSKSAWQVKNLFAETLRAWRAYGASFVYHAEVPSLFAGTQPRFPTVAKLDPRRQGATAEGLDGSLQAGDDLSEFGQKVRDATAPLMMFIGGADGLSRARLPRGQPIGRAGTGRGGLRLAPPRFTLKDHAYTSGETVRKVLVVVNDTDAEARISADWTLEAADGQVAARGALALSVPPGRQETRQGVIQFNAPAVQRRTDLMLRVSARTAGPETVAAPALALTVFPSAPPSPLPAADLILFDPVGDTRAALARLGVQPRPMPARLEPHHRLLVGRRALMENVHRKTLADAGFDEAVLGGMRVLIFEQAAPDWEGTLMGLRLKRIETRRAFVRAPGHPALEGLADPDFSFLRGDSDLIEPYPDPGPMPQEYPTHFWHWGNDNIVATYALEKPQVGAARALLDCGFDLAEAALLEAARGEGLLLFCQVDVTHRVGDDPVCTRLVQNLLRCLSLPADRPAGAVSLAELARRNPPAATVEGYRFPAPALPGIHDGDLFFRERLRLPAFDPRSRSPLFTEVESAGQRCWITSLSAAELRSDWQRARRARVESALRLFNGERTVAGPSLQAFDDRNRLYPYNWAHLPLMGCDFDPYVYWRW